MWAYVERMVDERMSNKSKKQQKPKGPVRSRESGKNARKDENRRKRKARKRAEKRQEQMAERGRKVLAVIELVPATEPTEHDSREPDWLSESNDEILELGDRNSVSVEGLREQLKLARERKQQAYERRQIRQKEMMLCRDVMNEEFEGLQEERKKKDQRRQDYEELRDRNNARITKIKEKIETKRHKRQNYFDRSKRAYHTPQTRDKAVAYSERGQKYEKDCNDLFEEMHALGREVRERRLAVEADTVDDKFFEGAREEYQAAKDAYDAATAEYEEARAEVIRLEEELMERMT